MARAPVRALAAGAGGHEVLDRDAEGRHRPREPLPAGAAQLAASVVLRVVEAVDPARRSEIRGVARPGAWDGARGRNPTGSDSRSLCLREQSTICGDLHQTLMVTDSSSGNTTIVTHSNVRATVTTESGRQFS
jgi:hypothetical protein